jgi:hypothetical protein
MLVILGMILHAGGTDSCPLPSMDKIPFLSFMDIPPVYSGTATSFSKCHLGKMCTPEFLSGDWAGYYSHNRMGGITMDRPMHTIRIEASRAPGLDMIGNEKIVIDKASEGRDGHRYFQLSGTVGLDGRVTMSKMYSAHRWSWDWAGEVTPFGLAGVWGNPGYGRFGGYFWIWKKEWCE